MQVKLNSNLEAKTIDELKKTRQDICLEFAYELCKEARQLLRKLTETTHEERTLRDVELETKLSDFIKKIRHPNIPGVQCAGDCVGSQLHACAYAIYFNDPRIFDRQMKKTFSVWRQMMLEEGEKLQHSAQALLRGLDADLKANVSAKLQLGITFCSRAIVWQLKNLKQSATYCGSVYVYVRMHVGGERGGSEKRKRLRMCVCGTHHRKQTRRGGEEMGGKREGDRREEKGVRVGI